LEEGRRRGLQLRMRAAGSSRARSLSSDPSPPQTRRQRPTDHPSAPPPRNHPAQVRTRDNVVHGMFSVADVVAIMKEEKEARALGSIFSSKTELRRGSGAADGAVEAN